MARIGILTGGGECPGLNAVIRSCVLRGLRHHGDEFIGFIDGWRGLLEGNTIKLWMRVRGIVKEGGAILGTSRASPLGPDGGVEQVQRILRTLGIDALIVIGGEQTLTAARILSDHGVRIIGIPKSIDNDSDAMDATFGFDSAVEIATIAIDRLKTADEFRRRCMITEVIGRRAGWIALHAGMATSAHAILIPEQRPTMDEICGWVEAPFNRGRSPLIVVAEGFVSAEMEHPESERGLDIYRRPRLGGIGERLAAVVEEWTNIETRSTTLGHSQRGGIPSAADRVLAMRLGMAAVEAVHDGAWGHLVAVRGPRIVRLEFGEAVGRLKAVPQGRYDEAATFFG